MMIFTSLAHPEFVSAFSQTMSRASQNWHFMAMRYNHQQGRCLKAAGWGSANTLLKTAGFGERGGVCELDCTSPQTGVNAPFLLHS